VQVGGDPENPFKMQADVAIFDEILKTVEGRRQDKAHG